MRLDPPRRPHMAVYRRNLVISDDSSMRLLSIERALKAQIELVDAHVGRVAELRDRYDPCGITYASIETQRVYWQELLRILEAVQGGKAVPPS